MLIGAVIVTYNPKIELLRENIDAIREQVSSVLIVDNGSKNCKEVKKLVNKSGEILLELGDNVGIATALNKGIEYFSVSKYQWVMTLDQDSIAPLNLIEALTNIDEFQSHNTGVIAADFIDLSQGETSGSRSGINGYSKRVITSGSLTSINIWDKVGRFDDQLFIDYVDHDFNQRVMEFGFNIVQVSDVYLKHSLGEGLPDKKNWLSKIFHMKSKGHTEHSAFRQYYIYRNGIIFIKRYSKHKISDFIKLISDIRWILLFSNPIKQMMSACHGIFDGIMYSPKRDVYFQKYLKLKMR